jgi:hypothetical protein
MSQILIMNKIRQTSHALARRAHIHTVTWRLKAEIVKSERMSIASQRLGELVPKRYKNRRPLLHNGSSYCGSLHAVESRCPRQRYAESTATGERDDINCWERCDMRGRLKGCVRSPGETKVRAVCSRRVTCEKPSVEENSEGSWIVEVLKTLFHVL